MPELTRPQALSIQNALIDAYQSQDFQEKLRVALADAGNDTVAQMHARHQVCLSVQGPIITKYGFESTLNGVQDTFAALSSDDRNHPDIKERLVVMSALTRQDPSRVKTRSIKETVPGRYWLVSGGAHSRGLVVRKDRDLVSHLLYSGTRVARLMHGAVVREIERDGQRLHYQKVAGDGPDFGWVTIDLHGKALLEPVGDPVEGLLF